MLSVDGLTTDYGPVRAVDGVSLEVGRGTVTAVLGANGAGKTTLLRTICGSRAADGRDRRVRRRGHHPARRSRRSSGAGSLTCRRDAA